MKLRSRVKRSSKTSLGEEEGLGSLACCSPWGHKESDTAERLNNNNKTNDARHNDLDCRHKAPVRPGLH